MTNANDVFDERLDSQKVSARLTWFSIFTSASTLVCCAIPALLVAIGAGAALASLVGAVPQIVWLSEHKTAVFSMAGVMLAIAGYFQWQARFAPCPLDPALAEACTRQRKISKTIYFVSVAIYLLGGFFAFVLPAILY
ncbi:MAG: hypothetical protein ACRDAM_13550 [Casimicrobium sp.]